MAAQLFTLPRQIAISSSFAALPGAYLKFFLSGTSTPAAVYQDADLSTPHDADGVEADAGAVFPVIYLDPSISYKVEYYTSADVLIYTSDPCNSAFPSSGQVNIASSVAGTANAITAALVPAIDVYTPQMAVVFTPAGDNTSSVTFNLSSVGALPIQFSDGSALTGAELQEDYPALLILNKAGTAWILQTPYVLKSRGLEVGYRGLAVGQTITTSTNILAAANGKIVVFSGAGGQTITLASGMTPSDVAVTVMNYGSASVTIANAGSFNWLNGSGTLGSGNRTLAVGGVATVFTNDGGSNGSIFGMGLT